MLPGHCVPRWSHCVFYVTTSLLQHSKIMNPASSTIDKANKSSLASQETPRILQNKKIHYHNHRSPPPVPVLS
jgi:hypothetical protein